MIKKLRHCNVIMKRLLTLRAREGTIGRDENKTLPKELCTSAPQRRGGRPVQRGANGAPESRADLCRCCNVVTMVTIKAVRRKPASTQAASESAINRVR